MHPTVIAALAEARHAELLRNADAWRRSSAPSRTGRRTGLAGVTAALIKGVAHLRHRVVTLQQTAVCCA